MSDGQTQTCEQIKADESIRDSWDGQIAWKAACIGDYILNNPALSNVEKSQIERHLDVCVRVVSDHNERKR